MGTLWRTLRTVMYKISVSGIGLISASATAHFLSVAERGTYTFVTFTLLFGTAFISGYNNYLNFAINRQKHSMEAVVGVAARFVVQILTINVALLVAALILQMRFAGFYDYSFILATMPFVILFGYGSRILQVMNEIEWVNRLNTLQSLLFAAYAVIMWLIYHFAHGGLGAHALTITLLAWLVTNAIATTAVVIVAHRLANVSFRPRRDPELRRAMFSYGHQIAVQRLLLQANYRGDAFTVNWMMGSVFTGLYGIAVTSSEILWQVANSISLIVYARIAREEREGSMELTERSVRLTFWVLVIGAIGMLLIFAPLMHIVFGDKYARSVAPFRILIIGTMGYGVVGVFTQFFTDQLGKVRFPLILQACCVVINVGLCLILIPHIGMMGAATGSTAAYVVALMLCVYYYHRQTRRPIRGLFLPTVGDLQLLQRMLPRRRLHELGK